MDTSTPTTPTVCINFMGAPGVGKTTMAARVFSELKLRGHTAEWVGEYAKKLVYLKRFEELNNQYMVSSKQADLFDALKGCVKFIVTDGALAHGLYYNRFNPHNTSDVTKTHAAIMRRYSNHANINILLERGDFPYETTGRYQSEAEARAMDDELKTYLATECGSISTPSSRTWKP
jgi:tRNA uridine 5-carbamoylmethylation protein Kti12